jgi:hypothetical protein
MYKLNTNQSKILYDKLKEFRKEFEMNSFGNTAIENKKDTTPVRSIPSIEERLKNIRIRYLSENRKRNTIDSISEGFVYLVENPAWPGWVKVGMTIDYEKRLLSYNSTYDPHNKYSYIDIKWVKNRKEVETELLNLFESKADNRSGEWFKISKPIALQLFKV